MHGDKAHSCYFGKDAIPFDKLESFFTEYLG